jgi:hypothetical protein
MAKGNRPRCGLAITDGRERPAQLAVSSQLRLVFFDDNAIIPSLLNHHRCDMAWGQEGVHRDKAPCQDSLVPDGLDGGDLMGFVVHSVWGQRHTHMVG